MTICWLPCHNKRGLGLGLRQEGGEAAKHTWLPGHTLGNTILIKDSGISLWTPSNAISWISGCTYTKKQHNQRNNAVHLWSVQRGALQNGEQIRAVYIRGRGGYLGWMISSNSQITRPVWWKLYKTMIPYSSYTTLQQIHPGRKSRSLQFCRMVWVWWCHYCNLQFVLKLFCFSFNVVAVRLKNRGKTNLYCEHVVPSGCGNGQRALELACGEVWFPFQPFSVSSWNPDGQTWL
jgi:hypothetical protein